MDNLMENCIYYPNKCLGPDCEGCKEFKPKLSHTGNLREEIAAWEWTWNQGGCHWSEVPENVRENYRKRVDAILAIIAAHELAAIKKTRGEERERIASLLVDGCDDNRWPCGEPYCSASGHDCYICWLERIKPEHKHPKEEQHG